MVDAAPLPDAAAIEARLIALLTGMPRLHAASVDPERPFGELGIDSLEVIAMTYELEQWLHIAIDPAVIYDFPTPRTFVHHLAQRLAVDGRSPAIPGLAG